MKRIAFALPVTFLVIAAYELLVGKNVNEDIASSNFDLSNMAFIVASLFIALPLSTLSLTIHEGSAKWPKKMFKWANIILFAVNAYFLIRVSLHIGNSKFIVYSISTTYFLNALGLYFYIAYQRKFVRIHEAAAKDHIDWCDESGEYEN